jgi:ABC-type uncharacterized transport system fused permease/ATPase subunit
MMISTDCLLTSLNTLCHSLLFLNTLCHSLLFLNTLCHSLLFQVLSLGEQQRLAFARVLYNRPTIVFLDGTISCTLIISLII